MHNGDTVQMSEQAAQQLYDNHYSIVEVFRCFVEEWGEQNVTLNLPTRWQTDRNFSSLGCVKVLFENPERLLSIHAGAEDYTVERHFVLAAIQA